MPANRASLKDVHHVANLAADNIVSIGSSLSHVHVPGRKVTEAGEDELTFEEVEIGMGKPNEHTLTNLNADFLCQVSTTKQAPSERKQISPAWSNRCWHTC
jgi:dihydroxyacetone kinase